jgi:hypothetical protein
MPKPLGPVARGRTRSRAAATHDETGEAGLLTPLGYLLSVLRDPGRPEKERFEAAKAAAPYVHARLSSVDHSGGVHLAHEDALDELE